MAKLKTHKGVTKRFRITAKGKVKRHKAGKRHLQSHKTGKRRRQLRRRVIESDALARKIVASVGGVL